MRTSRPRQRCAALAVALLAVAACGGGNDSPDGADTAGDADSPADVEQAADPGADVASDQPSDDGAQAVNGALVSVLDLGLGLYGIDRDTGDHFELSYETDWFTDRNTAPFVLGDHAYTLVFREVEDLSFVNETAVAEFDLTTGQGRQIVSFGPDSESAESLERTSWTLFGAGGDSLWLRRDATDAEGATVSTVLRYSIATGEMSGEVASLSTDLTTDDGGSCTLEARPMLVDPAGVLIVSLGGLPGIIDPDTLTPTELMPSCFNPDVTVAALADATPVTDFAVVADDLTLPPDSLERLFDTDATISDRSITATSDEIWWIFNTTRSTFDADDNEYSVLIGGVARLDRATADISLFPLGDAIGEFLDPEANNGFTVSPLSQAGLQVVDGHLWIMDRREAQPLRRLDPASGALDEFDIEVGEGNEFVQAELIPTDPDGVWLSVSRKMVTSEEDDGSRSTVGQSFIDQVDPVTGTTVRSIPEGELTGFGN